MRRQLPVLVGLVVLASVAWLESRQELSRDEADSMAAKVATIVVRGSLPPLDAEEPIIVRTSFTEREANAYFSHYGPEFLPTGVVNPTVRIGQANRVTARAIVNLDLVRESRERGWLDPLAYVSGLIEVEGVARLLASNGMGVIQFESASVGGVSVSESLFQEIITFFTATPEDPDGYQLGEPEPLPASIRAVELKPGMATVVQ